MKLTGLGLLGLLPVGVPASEAIGQGGRTPCSGDFKPPVYEFNDFSVTASLYKGGGEPMGLLNINFTMRDLANDVVLWCNWTITKMSSYGDDDWYDVEDICTSDGRFKTDFRTQSYISVESFSIDEGKQGPISIVQFWYCERDDGSYPFLYQASAHLDLGFTCPEPKVNLEEHACNVTTALPATLHANWTTPDTPTAKQLFPHLLALPARPKGMKPPPARDCTDMSLTYPEYIIDDAQHGRSENQSTLNLNLTSRATGMTVTCSGNIAQAKSSVDLSCTMLTNTDSGSETLPDDSKLHVKYDLSKTKLEIFHSWTCGDTIGQFSTEFEATASAIFPSDKCTDDDKQSSCQMNSITVMGTLKKPVALKPDTYSPLPPNMEVAGCTAKSTAPEWKITEFKFNETSIQVWNPPDRPPKNPNDMFPDEANNTPLRILEAEITNAANGYKTSCRVTNQYAGGVEDVWLACNRPEDHDVNARYTIDTYIYLNSADGSLTVNQTWFCSDEDKESPLLLSATGDALVDCGWTNTTDPESCGPSGEDNPFRCTEYKFVRWCRAGSSSSSPPAIIEGHVTRQEHLAIKALTNPDPNSSDWSCTASSLGRPVVWSIQPARFAGGVQVYADRPVFTDWPDRRNPYNMETDLIFDLNSSALAAPTPTDPLRGIVGLVMGFGDDMTPGMPRFDPTKWHRANKDFPFGNTQDLRFRYDAVSSYIEIEHTWFCDDKDRANPIIFEGKWNGYLPLDCHLPTVGNKSHAYDVGIKCTFSGGHVQAWPTVVHHTSAGPPDAGRG